MGEKSGAGRLRETITINTISKTRDGYGDSSETTSDFASSIRAKVVTLSSSQGGNDAVSGLNQYRITVRYQSGITEAKSITWGSKTLDITGFIEDDKHRGWLVILAKERKID